MAMTPDERRARDRERKRIKRAEERTQREAAAQAAIEEAAHNKPEVEVPSMADAVENSLAAMKWLAPSDDASVAQARALAAEIDRVSVTGDVAKVLSGHRALSQVLKDLGGTPTVRIQHELRSLKLSGKTGGEGDGDEVEGSAGHGAVVSKFERPKKRARG